MIILGGITLNRDMIWSERAVSFGVAQSVRQTIGGVPVVFSGSVAKGVPITLSASEYNGSLIGVLKKSVVDAVLALAVTPGATYTLNLEGTEHTVIFRHHEPPAVDMTPLVAKLTYGANDLYRGQIKLLTV